MRKPSRSMLLQKGKRDHVGPIVETRLGSLGHDSRDRWPDCQLTSVLRNFCADAHVKTKVK